MSNHESRKIITKTESITNKRLGHKKGFHFYSFFYGHLLLIVVCCCCCCYFGPLLFLGSVLKIFFCCCCWTRTKHTLSNRRKWKSCKTTEPGQQPTTTMYTLVVYWLKRYKHHRSSSPKTDSPVQQKQDLNQTNIDRTTSTKHLNFYILN